MAGSSSHVTATNAAVPVAHSVLDESSPDLDKNTVITKLVDHITTLVPGRPASKQHHQQYNSPALITRIEGRCNNNKPSNIGTSIGIGIGGDGRVRTGGKEFFEKQVEQQMLRKPPPGRESHRPAANIDPSSLFAIKFSEIRNSSLASSARRNLSIKRRSPYRCG